MLRRPSSSNCMMPGCDRVLRVVKDLESILGLPQEALIMNVTFLFNSVF